MTFFSRKAHTVALAGAVLAISACASSTPGDPGVRSLQELSAEQVGERDEKVEAAVTRVERTQRRLADREKDVREARNALERAEKRLRRANEEEDDARGDYAEARQALETARRNAAEARSVATRAAGSSSGN